MACFRFVSLSLSLLPAKSAKSSALQLKLFEVPHIQGKACLIIRTSFTPAMRSELLLLLTSEETIIRFDWFPDILESCCKQVILSILVNFVPLMASSCRIGIPDGIGIVLSTQERSCRTNVESWSLNKPQTVVFATVASVASVAFALQ